MAAIVDTSNMSCVKDDALGCLVVSSSSSLDDDSFLVDVVVVVGCHL